MIKVLSPGFYTSVQDLGRFGYGDIGVPISGVMDTYSAKIANTVIGNLANAPVLEITLGKCALLFENQTIICVSGANLSPKLNDNLVALSTLVKIQKGDVLSFDKSIYGVRSYLAVKDGFQTEEVLNSKSFYDGVTDGRRIQKGTILPFNTFKAIPKKSLSSVKVNKTHFTSKTIEAFEGPEHELLNKEQKEKIGQTQFTISKDNSRMGYRLEELVENVLTSMLTSAVLPGTVQLTPSGKLIVLMRDCQVTGGYPRILQLEESAINKLAQKTTRDRFNFKIAPLN